MKNFWKLGAVFAMLALLFTGCPDDNGNGNGEDPTDPVVTSVDLAVDPVLKITLDGGFGVAEDEVYTFSATVNGTDGTNGGDELDSDYEIVIVAVGVAVLADLIEEDEAYSGTGPRTITILDGEGSFAVKAVSKGDGASAGTKVSSETWTIAVVDESELLDTYLTAFYLVAYNEAAPTVPVTTLTAMAQGSTWYVGAVVEGEGTFDSTYVLEIELSIPALATVTDLEGAWATTLPGGKKIVVSPTAFGTIEITAEASEEYFLPTVDPVAEWEITVAPSGAPPAPNWGTIGWMFHQTFDRAVTTGTTTTLPSVSNGRFTIRNNEPNAMLDSADAVTADDGMKDAPERRGMIDATFMVLDQPVMADARPGYFKAYGIEAQIRITADRDENVSVLNHQRGIWLGAFTDPRDYIQELGSDGLTANPSEVPHAVGIRLGAHGQRRGIYSRVEAPNVNWGGIGMNQAGGLGLVVAADVPNDGHTWFTAFQNNDYQSANDPTSGPRRA
ncbi:MAG: hypothetical protein FWD26_01580, partial [Treponema sp.]|nr:hypothetical protein [Treponema sp.]